MLGILRDKRSVANSLRRSPTNTQQKNMDKATPAFTLVPSFARADLTPSHWVAEAIAIRVYDKAAFKFSNAIHWPTKIKGLGEESGLVNF